MAAQTKNWWLYVLRLEQGKWYVGITSKTPEIRFQEHQRGYYAAEWTKKYKAIELYETKNLGYLTKDEAEAIEHHRTKELMTEKGWQHVRGGRFRSLEYKKRYGILWRVNVEKDMPTIVMLQGIEACIIMLLVILILGLKIYL